MTANRFALLLGIAMLAVILLGSDYVINTLWIEGAQEARCREDCDDSICFAEAEVAMIPIRDSYDIDVDVTQCIVEKDVHGDSLGARILRVAGRNHLPSDPPASPDELFRSREYKTHNRIRVQGRVVNGVVIPGRPIVEAKSGPTKFGRFGMFGATYADTETSRRPPPENEAYCLLAAIARPATIFNRGKRIHIGSEIAIDVHPRYAIVRVRYSRFPTTFIWINGTRVDRRAEPLEDILRACSRWL